VGETLKIPVPLVETAAVNGYVFNEENKNGVKDRNESGIYEARVTLMGPEGISRETFTNLNRRFSLGVVPGEYEVKVDPPYLGKVYSNC